MKISLLMTFISVSISLKTPNIFENKSRIFEKSGCTITVHNDIYYNELVNETNSIEISHKIKQKNK